MSAGDTGPDFTFDPSNVQAQIVAYRSRVLFTKNGIEYEYTWGWDIAGANTFEELNELDGAPMDIVEGDDPILTEQEREALRTAAMNAALGKSGFTELADVE